MTREEDKIRDAEGKKRLHVAFRARVDQLCIEKGITYYNLAYSSSIPMSTLTHMLRDESASPGIYNIMKMCDGLGMSLSTFFDSELFEDAMIESRDEK